MPLLLRSLIRVLYQAYARWGSQKRLGGAPVTGVRRLLRLISELSVA
ncbi:hypothetical protein [Rothia sp. (in: high G+C Gram-positive bacteria)]